MISDIAPGHVSMRHGFRGPNYTTVSACASSTNALIDSYNMIRLGKADVIVTGGSEACINEAGVGGFNALRAMSTRNDDPASASRPFDKERDGFVLGEGGASLILEDYEHAKARGAEVYAEVVGWGLSADAYHITAPDPEGKGVFLVMKNALETCETRQTLAQAVQYEYQLNKVHDWTLTGRRRSNRGSGHSDGCQAWYYPTDNQSLDGRP